MTCKYVELLIPYKHLEEGRRILDITTIRKASSYWARRIGHIYGLKISINLVVTHDGFMSLVKMLLLAISLIAKHRILKGHVAVYNIRIVIEFIIKDVWG
jgi:hypothetical protein